MDILEQISSSLSPAFYSSSIKSIDVFRRSVLIETTNGEYGLSTNSGDGKDIDTFIGLNGEDLLARLNFLNHFHRSIFLALFNAINSKKEKLLEATKQKAHHFVYTMPKGGSVAVVGRFPFVEKFRESGHFSKVALFELDPRYGEFGPGDYSKLTDYETVFITAMTLANNTFDNIISFCNSKSKVILLGPTTPMLSLLFECGVSMIAGAVVTDGVDLKRCLAAGNSFRASTGLEYFTLSNL